MKRVLLAIVSLCSIITRAQTLFEGHLDNQLHRRDDWICSEQWKPATEQDRKLFAQPLNRTDRVWVGSLCLGQPEEFLSAVVTLQTGRSYLYVDRSQAKHFSEQEKTLFRALPGDKDYSAELELVLPLPKEPYRTVSVPIRLPANAASTANDARLTVLFASNFYVEGSVFIGSRKMLMRFEYDPGKGGVDLEHGFVWLDLNGDGMLDDVGEGLLANGKKAVFHVGDLYVRPKQINVAEGVFTLEKVPASEYTRFDVWKGGVLPDFAFDDLNGAPHHLSDLKGKYVLLDFWATWCASCIADMKQLQVVYAQYHDRSFEILGLHPRGESDTAKQAARLVEKLQIPWPQGQLSSDLIDNRFGVKTLPFLILIDQQGHIVEIGGEKLQGDNLGKTLAKYLPPEQ